MLFRAFAVVLAVAAGLFAVSAVRSSRLPYDDEGRYFDAEESVVYHEQDTLSHGLLAAGCAACAVGAWLGGRWGRARAR